MTANAFALYWFVMFPAAVFCLQYGWDMVFDDVVPMRADQED
jgi:hypothetical protein